jgi:hypothetical protein
MCSGNTPFIPALYQPARPDSLKYTGIVVPGCGMGLPKRQFPFTFNLTL